MSASQYPIRDITSAPARLVENQQYQLGCFDSPIREANLLDIPSAIPFVPRWLKNLHLREWQAFQIKNGDYFVMIAVYNAKKMALVHFIVYNFKTKEKVKYEKQLNLFSSIVVPNSLYDSHCYYHGGDISIDIHHDLASKKMDISVKIQNFPGGLPDLEAEFHGIHDVERYKPMVVCNPFSHDSVMFSHKCLMPGSGSMRIAKPSGSDAFTTVDFPSESTQIIIDDHKGFYPYVTRYDWVTALGKDEQSGKLIGFNLTNNQVVQQDKYNENCLWFDGELHPLPPIRVTRPDGYKGVWFVQDEHDMVRLEFEPVTHTSVNLNLIVACSKYEGPYGVFRGYVRKRDGEKVVVDGMVGMGEDFYLRI